MENYNQANRQPQPQPAPFTPMAPNPPPTDELHPFFASLEWSREPTLRIDMLRGNGAVNAFNNMPAPELMERMTEGLQGSSPLQAQTYPQHLLPNNPRQHLQPIDARSTRSYPSSSTHMSSPLPQHAHLTSSRLPTASSNTSYNDDSPVSHKRRRSHSAGISYPDSALGSTPADFSPSSSTMGFVPPQRPSLAMIQGIGSSASQSATLQRSPSRTCARSQNRDMAESKYTCLFCGTNKGYRGVNTFINHLKGVHVDYLKENAVDFGDSSLSVNTRLAVLACGLCICEPFGSEDALYRHIADHHCKSDKHSRGKDSCAWDFSKVMKNHLNHRELRQFFNNWIARTFPGVTVTANVSLSWSRTRETYSVLRDLQRLETYISKAEVLVDRACGLYSEAKECRVLPRVTPDIVSSLVQGAGTAHYLPENHPSSINLEEDDLPGGSNAGPITSATPPPQWPQNANSNDFMDDLVNWPASET